MSAKLMTLASAAFCALVSFGETVCTWTGAEDAFWTNANNWAEGVVPGQYKVGTEVSGDLEYVAEFGAVADGKATTVDLDGHYAVAKVTVKSGAPAYVFGLSTSQVFSFKPKGGSGAASLIVQNGAAGVRVAAKYGVLGTSVGSARIENWSAEELTFDKYGYNDVSLGDATRSYVFAGSGDIRIKTRGTHNFLMYKHSLQMTGGRLCIDCEMIDRDGCGQFWQTTSVPSGYDCEIVLGPNGKIGTYNTYGDYTIIGTLRVTGEGTFRATGWSALNTSIPCSIYGRMVIDVPVVSFDAGGWYRYDGTGTTEFNAVSAFTGDVDILGGGTVKAGLLGQDGSDSHIGTGKVKMSGAACFLYSGVGETTDRVFCLTNANLGTANVAVSTREATGVVEQGGTGKLTITSDLASYCVSPKEATLILANSTGNDAEWSGKLDDPSESKLNVTKRGTGTWILSGANGFTGKLTLEGGTLEVSTAASLANASGIVVTGGRTTLVVADGVSLEIPSLTQSGSGIIDLALGEGSSFKCSGLTPGFAPAWLLVNGVNAEIKQDGSIVACQTAWKSATSGDWNTAANWDNGVPDANHTAKIVTEGDYTVSVAAAAPTATSLTLQHATVDVAAPMSFTNAWLNFGSGAKWLVNEGGAVRYDGTGIVGSRTATDGSVDTIKVSDGATVKVADGGLLCVANHTGRFVIGGTGDPASVIVREGGTFTYTNKSSVGQLVLAEGGTLAVTGGTVTVTGSAVGTDEAIRLEGGVFSVSNGSVLAKNFRYVRGHGSFSVSGTGSIDFYNEADKTVSIEPDSATDEIDISVLEKGRFGRAGGYLKLGGSKGGRVKMNVELGSRTDPIVPSGATDNNMGLQVGVNTGFAELNQTNATMKSGNYGLDIAFGDGTVDASSVTGRYTLVNAVYTGYPLASRWTGGCWAGLSVGQGLFKPVGGWNDGSLTLVSGEIQAGYGALGIGLGRATGVFSVLGGAVTYSSTLDGRRLGNAIGFAGGDGTLVVSNGTCSVGGGTVFVGGCSDADLNRASTITHSNTPVGGQTSKGLLSIQGGTFTANVGVTVGADGTGTLAFGPSGSFATPDLILSNQCASVLRYDFTDAKTVTKVSVTNLVITSGAKLAIDATQVTDRYPVWTKLVSAETVTGRFAANKVEVLSDGENPRFVAKDCEIVYERGGENGLWFRTARSGLTVIVR